MDENYYYHRSFGPCRLIIHKNQFFLCCLVYEDTPTVIENSPQFQGLSIPNMDPIMYLLGVDFYVDDQNIFSRELHQQDIHQLQGGQ